MYLERENAVRAEERLGRHFLVGQMYLRLIDSCITQLEAQGPSRTCNESKEEEGEEERSDHSRLQKVVFQMLIGELVPVAADVKADIRGHADIRLKSRGHVGLL